MTICVLLMKFGHADGGGFLICREHENSMCLAVCIAFRPVEKRGESFAFEQNGGFDSNIFVPNGTTLISRSVERLRDTTGTRRENTPRS